MPNGHEEYTPLVAKFPMSWPPDKCNYCLAGEIVWAYPLGHVNFPRVDPESNEEVMMPHHSQQWYACARCRQFIEADNLEELAKILNRPQGFFEPLKQARLKSQGFPWGRPTPGSVNVYYAR